MTENEQLLKIIRENISSAELKHFPFPYDFGYLTIMKDDFKIDVHVKDINHPTQKFEYALLFKRKENKSFFGKTKWDCVAHIDFDYDQNREINTLVNKMFKDKKDEKIKCTIS